MNIIFNQTISYLECLNKANKHINNCIEQGYKSVAGLNKSEIKNRKVEYALIYFVEQCYYCTSEIQTTDQAYHYGQPIGTILKHKVGLGQLPVNDYAKHLYSIKCLADKLNGN